MKRQTRKVKTRCTVCRRVRYVTFIVGDYTPTEVDEIRNAYVCSDHEVRP